MLENNEINISQFCNAENDFQKTNEDFSLSSGDETPTQMITNGSKKNIDDQELSSDSNKISFGNPKKDVIYENKGEKSGEYGAEYTSQRTQQTVSNVCDFNADNLDQKDSKNSTNNNNNGSSSGSQKDGDDNPTKKKDNRIIGTPDYIAPEIINGESIENFGIDWWAFGCIIYECIVGIPPFNDSTVDKIFKNINNMNIEWPPIGYGEDEMTPEAQD